MKKIISVLLATFMRKFVSAIFLIAVCFSIFVVPVSAEEYSVQSEYERARDFVSNIDFDFFLSLPDLGDDVIADLKNIQNYITTHNNYTMTDICELTEPANTDSNIVLYTRYDYSSLLPTSKDLLNDEEKEVFNSNPAYGLSVLLQASYANSQEQSRFGSNTWATNGDAFRHALWNALGAHFTSESYMCRFATAHETGASGYNPNSIDTKMDLRNNASGRSLVKSMDLPSNPPNGMVIPYLISNNIATATKNGKLVRFVVGGVQYNTLKATDSATTN